MGLTPAFSTPAIMPVPHFPLTHFQSPLTRELQGLYVHAIHVKLFFQLSMQTQGCRRDVLNVRITWYADFGTKCIRGLSCMAAAIGLRPRETIAYILPNSARVCANRAGAGLTSSVSKVCICGILVYRAYFSTSYFVIFSIHFSFASHQAINCGRLHCDVWLVGMKMQHFGVQSRW